MAHKLRVSTSSPHAVFMNIYTIDLRRKKPVQGRDYTVEKQFMQRESVGSEIGTVQ
jgi:hypothetical protein